jgi:3-hydroxyacyl-[acyl-carrier-protein] dehydratase
MGETQLNRAQIMEIIPHRDPMLLVDSVLSMTEGTCIEGSFYVDPDREIFKGHFPDEPVLPGVYTVEVMAQVSDILILSMGRYAGKVPLFIGIDKVRFFRKIQPGDTLRIVSRIQSERIEKSIVTCSAEVYNKGELACTGDVTLAMR